MNRVTKKGNEAMKRVRVCLLGSYVALDTEETIGDTTVLSSWKTKVADSFRAQFSERLDEVPKVEFVAGSHPSVSYKGIMSLGEKVVLPALLAAVQNLLLVQQSAVTVYVNAGQELTTTEKEFLTFVQEKAQALVIWTPSQIEDEPVPKATQMKRLTQVAVHGEIEDLCAVLEYLLCCFDVY